MRKPVFEADVVDGTFRSDEIERLFFERQVVHRTDDALHPVCNALTSGVLVQFVDEGGKHVHPDDGSGQVTCEFQRLRAASAP